MRDTPFLLSIIGSSGSGKSTLIVKIIEKLGASGLKVGAIKRSHHKVEVDKEGKDSFRFKEAGANPVALLSDDFFGYMERTEKPTSLSEVARNFAGKADIVLVEGFKEEGAIPKFLFVDSAAREKSRWAEYENVIGLITDSIDKNRGVRFNTPLFHRDDVVAITDMIVELMDGNANCGSKGKR